MSIERIKELNKIATQMEEMKAKAIGEITDRKELRIQALKKIQSYLKELSKATEGCYWTAETPLTIYWLVKQYEIGTKHYKTGVCFSFLSNGTVNIKQSAAASHLSIENCTNLTEFGRVYQDDTFHWEEGMVELIDKWKEIKPYIEQAAEKAMIARMTKAQKELADFKASYEKLADFEV
jgi:hypothetical protein